MPVALWVSSGVCQPSSASRSPAWPRRLPAGPRRPLTRRVGDVALALEVVSVHDSYDHRHASGPA
jgi:hypothetical protein